MGRHETFENAAPIAEEMLASTILGTRRSPAVEPSPSRGAERVPPHEHPSAYGLRLEDGSLGLHATPGAIVVVDPTIPPKAGLAVFYLKGRTIPAIFDLPRTFHPDMALPFALGSKVMAAVEAFMPETGALCHIPADRIEKVHRIIGIQTPVESGAVWRPMPKKLEEFAQCPDGMGEHHVADASAYPAVRPGETVIFDPSQRDPENVALCVLEWSNGTRSVLETNFRQSGGSGEARWWVDPVNRPIGDGALERRIAQGLRGGLLYSSDGPYTEEHLRERIVGRVVGILAPQQRPRDDDGKTATETAALPAPAPAPGSPEAMAAWHAACREHSIRTAPLNDCPELTRSQHETWTVRSLTQAMETGEISVAEYARLHPLVSERELRFAEITHELRIGELFALAYADEYPLKMQEPDPDQDGPDPVFAAIEGFAAARALAHSLDEVKDAERFLEADAQRIEALNALEDTRPTTVAGLCAMARTLDAYLREDIYAGDYDESFEGAALGALVAACRDLANQPHSDAQDEPLTIESAATLPFQAYTFDTPLRSPREWAAEYEDHAIAMHIADKTLRMTKPELMAFVSDASKRGDGTDEIMMKALTAASETFEGWAKFLHLAGTRYLVAGASAAIEAETEGGGA